MLYHSKQSRWLRFLIACGGCFICAISLNVFIVPQALYTGGLTGVCQLLRDFLANQLNFRIPGVDLVGVLYFVLNLPILLLAGKYLGKDFIGRTLVCTVVQSVCYSLVRVPEVPVIEGPLTSCLLGGILMGVGAGLMLTCGYSGGGTEMIGLYLSKKSRNITVGRFNICFNFVFYAVLLFLFDPAIVIYSIIYQTFTYMVVDKVHQQNITVQVMIVSKIKSYDMADYIMDQLGRGVTYWEGEGGYTRERLWVYCVVLSKYEIEDLRRAVHQIDPHAFFMIHEGVEVDGNFIRRVEV